jgi:hypothetical protein
MNLIKNRRVFENFLLFYYVFFIYIALSINSFNIIFPLLFLVSIFSAFYDARLLKQRYLSSFATGIFISELYFNDLFLDLPLYELIDKISFFTAFLFIVTLKVFITYIISCWLCNNNTKA